MILDGRQIAADIFSDLKVRVNKLKEKNINPHLYIILLSDDISSASYVRQKQLRADEIRVKITLDKEDSNISTDKLIEKIDKLNQDKSVHGIIVQRPMPKHLNEQEIANAVTSKKDIDGFNPSSIFQTPVAAAVLIILQTIHSENFANWLKSQKITVVGKGITAGGPIINLLKKQGIEPDVISSKTENRDEILKQSDIVISAVGKKDVINASELKQNVILIGVGMHKEEDQKFHGDFNEEEIKNFASYYSPTPGGVGPVNVACLMKNLVDAAEKSL